MGSTRYFVAASIDGFIADPDGNLDWLLQFDGMDGAAESYEEFLAGIGALVMGADTYRFLLAQKLPQWPYAGLPTWVFTTSDLPLIDGADIRFASGAVAPVHTQAREAARGKNIWMVGGGALAAQFLAAGLLDELILTVIPVVLGSGRQLLPVSGPTPALELMARKDLGRGAVELSYRFGSGPA
ncbi:MAG: dihydrofolate reductase family protein [Actinomycetales bacterium]|jgi:dihydrofolate reductase